MTLRARSQVPYVYAGAQPTESLFVTVEQCDSGLDLTTVSAVSGLVTAGDDSTTEWAFAIVSATPTLLKVQHVYQLADVPDPDDLSIMLSMTVPGGFRRVEPFRLIVKAPKADRDS